MLAAVKETNTTKSKNGYSVLKHKSTHAQFTGSRTHHLTGVRVKGKSAHKMSVYFHTAHVEVGGGELR